MKSEQALPPALYWLIGLLALLWGASWPFMKLVLTEMEPVRFRVFSMGVGTVGLFALAQFSGARLTLPRGTRLRVLVFSFFNMSAWSLLMIYGLQRMEAGRAVILAYTFPVWTIPLSAWLMREPVTRRRLLGLLLGIVGMALLLGDELFSLGRSPLGTLLIVASAVFWAIGTVLMKRWPVELPAISLTAWQSLFAWVPLALLGWAVEKGPVHPFGFSSGPLIGVLYNSVVSSIVCQWAWYRVVKIAPAGVSSLSTLIIPVVGVFISMLLLEERPHLSDYAALVLVVASLAVVLIPGRTGAAAIPQHTGGS
jgi:drug/metabolite transporter (DMT)-like permease